MTSGTMAAAAAGPGTAPAGAALSGEARLLAEGLGLPISALPGGPVDDREALRQYVRALNDLIVGPSETSPTWKLLRALVPAPALQAFDAAGLRLGLDRLWDRGELDVIEGLSLAQLEAEWKRRAAERMPHLAGLVRDDAGYAAFWADMPGGDFDSDGRGRDYTAGMRAFPACRALGVQALVSLIGAGEPGARVYLDVLGGEGYVWRLMEAQRQLARRQVVAVSPAELGGGDPARLSPTLADLLARSAQADPRAVILAVYDVRAASTADGAPRCAARLLRQVDGRADVSAPLELSGAALLAWLAGGGTEDGEGEALALAAAAGARADGPWPTMITNDVSRHMFYRAGLWGMPTREDALELSRTFRPGSLDGVMCAYGTHHIPGIYKALEESYAILKPGGCALVHDFFDRGPVGSWFHDVVDPYSKTGHDMPHIGPVEMAVHLFRAGFRDVELFEIDDPFIFTAEPDDELGARDLSLRYVMGMYGMSESFAHRVDDLEALIHQVLAYPELGQLPVFDQDFTLIPRRAVVARGYRPRPGADARYSAADAALIAALTEAMGATDAEILGRMDATADAARSWFTAGGYRWGLSPTEQQAWLDWQQAQAAAGTLG